MRLKTNFNPFPNNSFKNRQLKISSPKKNASFVKSVIDSKQKTQESVSKMVNMLRKINDNDLSDGNDSFFEVESSGDVSPVSIAKSRRSQKSEKQNVI